MNGFILLGASCDLALTSLAAIEFGGVEDHIHL
jgi:hypothetical protein